MTDQGTNWTDDPRCITKSGAPCYAWIPRPPTHARSTILGPPSLLSSIIRNLSQTSPRLYSSRGEITGAEETGLSTSEAGYPLLLPLSLKEVVMERQSFIAHNYARTLPDDMKG